MEFKGTITKLLPMRSGVGQRTGKEWKSQPFIFSYKEYDNARYDDSVVLETFDEKVIENMKEGMGAVAGFGHNVKSYIKQDGTDAYFTEHRLYKMELIVPPPMENMPQTEPPAPESADPLPF